MLNLFVNKLQSSQIYVVNTSPCEVSKTPASSSKPTGPFKFVARSSSSRLIEGLTPLYHLLLPVDEEEVYYVLLKLDDCVKCIVVKVGWDRMDRMHRMDG